MTTKDKRFALTIDLGNDAMQTNRDVADALRIVADKLDRDQVHPGIVKDTNGNKVGGYTYADFDN